MKNGDVMYAPSPTSRNRKLRVKYLGKSAKGNLRVKWLRGPLKGREALLEANTLRKNK